jgi:hypothetical protein
VAQTRLNEPKESMETKMARHFQRVPLELGLQLNINRLISDGFVQPGRVTQLSDFYWLDDEGDVRATAQIEANLTITSADNARYGTMRIQANWINQPIHLVGRPRHFGGLQWYFVCPVQNRCVSVLWSLPGRRFFAGRKSLGKQVAYLSQYHPPGARACYSADKLFDRTRPHSHLPTIFGRRTICFSASNYDMQDWTIVALKAPIQLTHENRPE